MQTQTYKICNEFMESSSSSKYEPEVYKWLQIKKNSYTANTMFSSDRQILSIC